jgi:hypothetical protein
MIEGGGGGAVDQEDGNEKVVLQHKLYIKFRCSIILTRNDGATQTNRDTVFFFYAISNQDCT